MIKELNAILITIGDEILIGQVLDTNSAWIAAALNAAGFKVNKIISVADSRESILNCLKEAEGKADLIIITGGLGPTKDDITKACLSEYFDSPLVCHEPSLKNVERIFNNRGIKISEINRKQADIPECAKPLLNKLGTAPGMWFERDNTIIVSMPGVPYEMKYLTKEYVIPELIKRSDKPHIYHRTVLTIGIGESHLSERIASWEDDLPEEIKLAYLPQPGMVRLRLTSFGRTAHENKVLVDNEIQKLIQLIPGLIFGFDNDKLESVIGSLLKEKSLSISTAESCTGGYIAHLLTSVAGSSSYYKGSVVSYANSIKEKSLGVNSEMLTKYGAVSREVVTAMAVGVRELMETDYSLATSGIAGPEGGTPEKPVGTVWIALASDNGVISSKFLFGEHRERNIRKAALSALNMLRLDLLK
jgi:nicotinamide-nucleotide amidase